MGHDWNYSQKFIEALREQLFMYCVREEQKTKSNNPRAFQIFFSNMSILNKNAKRRQTRTRKYRVVCVCIEILSFRHGHLMMLSCHSSGKQHVFLFLNAGSFPFSSCFLSTVTNHICIIYKWKVMLMPLNAWMGKLSMLQNTNDKWQQKSSARLILMDVFGEWNTLRRMALNIGPFFKFLAYLWNFKSHLTASNVGKCNLNI